MSTNEHTFRIAEQSGAWGFYCEIALTVSVLKQRELQVHHSGTDDPWKVAVDFGLQYAWEHLRPGNQQGVLVRVVATKTHPVDSSNSVVAYAAAMCLFKALGYTGKSSPKFLREEAAFWFPK